MSQSFNESYQNVVKRLNHSQQIVFISLMQIHSSASVIYWWKNKFCSYYYFAVVKYSLYTRSVGGESKSSKVWLFFRRSITSVYLMTIEHCYREFFKEEQAHWDNILMARIIADEKYRWDPFRFQQLFVMMDSIFVPSSLV